MNQIKNRFSVSVKVRDFILEDYNLGNKQLQNCIRLSKDKNKIVLSKDQYEERIFTFDHIYEPLNSQEDLFLNLARPVLDEIFEGYNGTLIAFGQTGSGKTYTIFGNESSVEQLNTKNISGDCGLVYRTLHYIFEQIYQMVDFRQFQVTISFIQIYNEQIQDLFGNPMEVHQIREDPQSGIFVEGLTQISVTSLEDAIKCINPAVKNRMSRSTKMNMASSRSHALIQILVEQRWIEHQLVQDEHQSIAKKVRVKHQKRGLLTIVDLAGSERLSKTNSQGDQLREAKSINKSIAALGNCIQALANENKKKQINNYPPTHIPYRDSKLTRLLSESICGNSRTAFCICVSPSILNYDESFSSLLFGNRAMMIRVDPQKNEELFYQIVTKTSESILNNVKVDGLFCRSQDNDDVLEIPKSLLESPLIDNYAQDKSFNQKSPIRMSKENLDAESPFSPTIEKQSNQKYTDIVVYLQQKLVKKTLQINQLKIQLEQQQLQ